MRDENSLKQLAANIHSLRIAHGETLEQLGDVLDVGKNTIFYYENAKREPSINKLELIAKHYMVPVDMLLHSDLTTTDRITVEKDILWHNLDTLFPIVSSEKAMQNEHFKKAVQIHTALYDQIRTGNLYGINDMFEKCIDSYLSIYEDEETFYAAIANMIAIFIPRLISNSVVSFIHDNQPAVLKLLLEQDKKIKWIIEKDVSAEFNDDKLKELLLTMLTVIRRSEKWSDLAYYYLALQYLYDIIDNSFSWEFNMQIGHEMMKAFASVNNTYAVRLLKLFPGIDKSSRSVDDKQ